jgi:hypothetical protein
MLNRKLIFQEFAIFGDDLSARRTCGLISGPIDPKPSANERELNLRIKQPLGPATSVKNNVVAKVIYSTINRNPCIALAKPVEMYRTFVFHPFLETTP